MVTQAPSAGGESLHWAPWAGRPGPETQFGGRGELQAGPRPGRDERRVGGSLAARQAQASDRALRTRTRTGGGRWPKGSPRVRGEAGREHASGTLGGSLPSEALTCRGCGAHPRRAPPERGPCTTEACRGDGSSPAQPPRTGTTQPPEPVLLDRAVLPGRTEGPWIHAAPPGQGAEPAQTACRLPQGPAWEAVAGGQCEPRLLVRVDLGVG